MWIEISLNFFLRFLTETNSQCKTFFNLKFQVEHLDRCELQQEDDPELHPSVEQQHAEGVRGPAEQLDRLEGQEGFVATGWIPFNAHWS